MNLEDETIESIQRRIDYVKKAKEKQNKLYDERLKLLEGVLQRKKGVPK